MNNEALLFTLGSDVQGLRIARFHREGQHNFIDDLLAEKLCEVTAISNDRVATCLELFASWPRFIHDGRLLDVFPSAADQRRKPARINGIAI